MDDVVIDKYIQIVPDNPLYTDLLYSIVSPFELELFLIPYPTPFIE